MDTGCYRKSDVILEQNNNEQEDNDRNRTKTKDEKSPKKKLSISFPLSVLSSLSEDSNGRCSSVSNLCDQPPVAPARRRRQSADVTLLKAHQNGIENTEVKQKGRRKSWHLGKFEKKRRKGIPVLGSLSNATRKFSFGSTSRLDLGSGDLPSPTSFEKQKRSSFWNLFIPDNWPRSRRSSDFAKPTEKIPYRGKSRSVDHGLSSPLDLDLLRSKVEGRFESVDKLCRDTDGDSRSGSKEQLAEKKMPKPLTRTIMYTVEPNDTLTSVAARFDTTPSELAILNRLPSRTVFPGQVIRVPEKKGSKKTDPETGSEGAENTSGADDTASEAESTAVSSRVLSESDSRDVEGSAEDDILDTLRPSSPKPGYPERVRSPIPAPQRRAIERFLKINVRHITDGQGVVSGVLLVTPNAVMFDPNVSDHLVIEHGPESYGVIAPMEFVVNAAIYYDIAHMRVTNTQHVCPDSCEKPEIYHSERKEGDSCLYRPKSDTYPGTIPERPSSEHAIQSQSITKEHSPLDSSTFSAEKRAAPEAVPSEQSTQQYHFREPSRSSDEGGSSYDEETSHAFDKHFLQHPPIEYHPKRTLERSEELCEKDSGSHSSDDRRTESPYSAATEREENAEDNTLPHLIDAEAVIKNLEERRKSSLDHHWAIPQKVRSVENEPAPHIEEKEKDDEDVTSTKPSCHDSGIDIRDPSFVPPVVPVQKKTVYSDADILLSDSNEFVPPKPVRQLSRGEEESVNQKKTSVSFSVEESKEIAEKRSSKGPSTVEEQEKQESKKNKMLKRLSYPLSWMEGITGEKEEKESLPSSAESSHPPHSSSSVFSKVFSRRSSVSSFIRQQHSARSDSTKSAGPRLDYISMVSVDDMPELFVSFDKLIPRPARSCEDPPLYLRLRMGKPKNRKIPRTTPIMSYGKKKMRPEYWFSVPRNRVDDLYRFLNLWVPYLYGDLNEKDVEERGYELVTSDTELWDDEEDMPEEKKRQRGGSDDLGDITRESWEVLSMSEELRRALYASNANSLDLELFLPDLIGPTEILTEEHRKQLCRHLPARAEGYTWTLVFSTSQDGFSLNSMYRKMNKVDSPILMVIQDTENNVFGTITSCALKVSDHFYGNGESFLFTFTPEFQVYCWTGENLYFIKGNSESLSIGAGDGKFGIWLDGDLYLGRTEACTTYGNEPLVPHRDFVVKTLECWAFL